ncbi:MAG: UDP-3-O-(3-hydroxymyristoyl)glucosamine N-acyltransferase [Ferruginibacter sp.]|nr:UDP-3-O-(3-hydroxymyristoyl)glucosamine N-acyltransferase [Ferruginibacter sp.]
MEFTAGQIAALIQGKIEGDAAISVSSFGKIEEALNGQLAFLANPKYEDYLYSTNASIVLLNDSLELKHQVKATLIRVKDPYSAFATLLDQYEKLQTQQLMGIEQPSFVHESVKMGNQVYIGAFTYIDQNTTIGNNVKIFPNCYLGPNVEIGNNSIILPGVKIYNNCKVGRDVKIHAGVVIGSDGFGFAPQTNGTFIKVPQIGNVVIEDNVEIGANATIDRATMGSTLIKSGAKIDNLVQIAHNVEIGSNTVIAAQAGVSGSTKIGNNVMIGGQAGIVGHIQIADGSKINAQSGVSKSIRLPNTAVTGSPAFEYSSALRSQAVNRNLPEMEKRLSELEQIIKSLRLNAD